MTTITVGPSQIAPGSTLAFPTPRTWPLRTLAWLIRPLAPKLAERLGKVP